MKLNVVTLDNKAAGSIEVADTVFGAPSRPDILARVVDWQLAKRRAGTHKAKTIADVQGTTKKPYAQKGTGRARQGSLRSPQFRGGAVIFGPVVRDHGYDLPKKVRRLGMRTALSSKQAEGRLIIVDEAKLAAPRTKELQEQLAKLGSESVLIVGGRTVDDNLKRAARNLKHVDVLPVQGANVYDILRREVLVLTKDAATELEARLK